MKLKEVLSRASLIVKSVEFIGKKTDSIHKEFETIEDCESLPCLEEKDRLRREMGSCINKLSLEKRELDRCESDFHACSGEIPAPTPTPAIA